MENIAYDRAYVKTQDAYKRWKRLEQSAVARPRDKNIRLLAWEAKQDYEDTVKELNGFFMPRTG